MINMSVRHDVYNTCGVVFCRLQLTEQLSKVFVCLTRRFLTDIVDSGDGYVQGSIRMSWEVGLFVKKQQHSSQQQID